MRVRLVNTECEPYIHENRPVHAGDQTVSGPSIGLALLVVPAQRTCVIFGRAHSDREGILL